MSPRPTTPEPYTGASPSQSAPAVGQGALSMPGLGEAWLVWSELGLCALGLPRREPGSLERDLSEHGLVPPPSRPVPPCYAEPLRAYAAGEAVEPAELPVDLRGSDFQLRVWRALRRIPRGEVRSYAAVAAEVGNPRATRAVGMANRANMLPVAVPCHRVVSSDGGLGGFSGGLDTKRRLLALEGVRVEDGRVYPGQLDLWARLGAAAKVSGT